MADPFSIAAATAGLIDVTVRLTIAINEFRKEVKGIDDDLRTLADEVNSLANICTSIKSIYREQTSTSTPQYSEQQSVSGDAGFQRHLEKALGSCSNTLCKIEDIIKKIRGGSDSSKKIDAIMKMMRKRLEGGDIRRHRAELAAHQNVLQLVLTALTIENMDKAQHSSSQSFEDLSDNLQNLGDKFESQITVLREDIRSADGYHYDKSALEALVSLREAVDSVAATVKLESTNQHFDTPQSVRTIFTGREAQLEDLKQLLVTSNGLNRHQFQKRFVIYGLGGSGKTQFCCKFAEENRDR
jgi:archaellum component FlaC